MYLDNKGAGSTKEEGFGDREYPIAHRELLPVNSVNGNPFIQTKGNRSGPRR
jgi:hypothetical protein